MALPILRLRIDLRSAGTDVHGWDTGELPASCNGWG
jgi:hypothetical protein